VKAKTETVNSSTLEQYIQLKQVDLKIKRGEMVCVIGDVASGKSTLLRTIVGDTIFVPQSLIQDYKDKPCSGDLLEEFSS
jgi:ABC-type phosphate/phosphonate transport system ATPase subunit